MARKTKPKSKPMKAQARKSTSTKARAATRTAARLKSAGQAPLSVREASALNTKIAIRNAVKVSPSQLGLQPPPGAKALFGRSMKDFPLGRFEGLENIRLRWVRPDWFEFIPR